MLGVRRALVSLGRAIAARRLASGIAAVAIIAGALVAVTLQGGSGSAHSGSAPVSRASRRLVAADHAAAVARVPATTPAAPSAPCATASAATIASVDSAVAKHIYMGELHSHEVSADIAHITGSRELLSALASSNLPAVYAAVHTIVYTPHWHIVRLRVVKNGRVLADVGGPYIIAPVSGTLRRNGRPIGSFVMSVQDDLGYVKLVSRFIGVPIDIYRGGSLVMGTLRPVPAAPRTGAAVRISGHTYQPYVLTARAFPSGTLQAALFVRTPPRSVSAQSCAAVRSFAWGGIAMHIAARFRPLALHYHDLVSTLRGTTGGLAFVRAGSRALAGGSSPRRLPSSGTVSLGGRSWSVFSWVAIPPARIYLLTPSA
jgi:hypothetical protein